MDFILSNGARGVGGVVWSPCEESDKSTPRTLSEGETVAVKKYRVNKPKNSASWRDSYYHRLFGLKAASEVARLLRLFEEERPDDRRPREALEAIKAWGKGERKLSMGEVRRLSVASHAAARGLTQTQQSSWRMLRVTR